MLSDMAGYSTSNRAGVEMEDLEPKVKIVLPDAVALRTIGDLVHFDNVGFRFPKAEKALLSNINFTVEQGSRIAFVGAVSTWRLSVKFLPSLTIPHRTGKANRPSPS